MRPTSVLEDMSMLDPNALESSLTESERQILIVAAVLANRGLPADRAAMEAFGHSYFGMYRAAWSAEGHMRLAPHEWPDAYESLQARGLLHSADNSREPSAEGRAIGERLARKHPKSRYFYDEYYTRIAHSQVHSDYCRRVYGSDLGQHGMTDQTQLDCLIERLALAPGERVLDLGGGDGRVAEYIADRTGARVTVLEVSNVAVRNGLARTAPKRDRIEFLARDMNEVEFVAGSFDAVIGIDSLYFVQDLTGFLARVKRWLLPTGRAAFLFSVWLTRGESIASLGADATRIAAALRASHMEYSASDLTAEEISHWRRKLTVSTEMAEAFAAEGNDFLSRWRIIEAAQHADYVDDGRVARYLYLALADATEG